jgi:hypothetical protein
MFSPEMVKVQKHSNIWMVLFRSKQYTSGHFLSLLCAIIHSLPSQTRHVYYLKRLTQLEAGVLSNDCGDPVAIVKSAE